METTAEVATINQQKDLAHLSELEQEIIGLKEQYKDLTINGPEDTAGYDQVRVAVGTLRSKRTGLESERKSVVKPYNDTVKLINGEYAKIEKMITDGPGGEAGLKEQKDTIDDANKRKAEEERVALEKKLNDRVTELLQNGMAFDGEFYSIRNDDLAVTETSIGIADIRAMSDDLYANILQVVKDKNTKIVDGKARIAAKEAQEKADREAKEKADREEFEKQKAELAEQKRQMDLQQAGIEAAQKKIDTEKREAEELRTLNFMRHRAGVLAGIGLLYDDQSETYKYENDELITGLLVMEAPEDSWLATIESLKVIVADKKKKAADFLADQLEKEQQRQKELQEKEEARKKLAEEERLAGMNDKQKVQEYVAALLSVPVPTVLQTKKWKSVILGIKEYLQDNKPV